MSGWGTIYNNARLALQMHSEKLVRLQEQASSGTRINRASDSPTDVSRILDLRSQSAILESYSRNLDEVVRTLEFGHGMVQDISDSLQLALQKIEQASSGTYGQETRMVLGEEINALLEQIVSRVNNSAVGRYVFGGSQSTAAPYAVTTDGQYITRVDYAGSQEELPVPVAPGIAVSGVMVGQRFFQSSQRGAPEFLGRTGAGPGAGTASACGDVYLQVTHRQTDIISDPDGTGLAVSSDAGFTDTALGQYDLVVDVQGKTIRFAGGPVRQFTGTETSLDVTTADGDVVYLDVTGLNGALVAPATVTIRSSGYLSIDPLAPATELTDFTDGNVAVLDSQGRVLYVDATGIRRTGVEPVRIAGTYDLFGALINARDLLLNRRDLSNADQRSLVAKTLDSLGEVLSGVTRGMTSVGARLEALDALDQNLQNIQATADDQAAGLENADMVQLAADLAQTQTLYQMTLAVAYKLLSLSLLDYL